MELAKDNIRVNAVSLGIIDTPLHDPFARREEVVRPAKSLWEVADVVRAVTISKIQILSLAKSLISMAVVRLVTEIVAGSKTLLLLASELIVTSWRASVTQEIVQPGLARLSLGAPSRGCRTS